MVMELFFFKMAHNIMVNSIKINLMEKESPSMINNN